MSERVMYIGHKVELTQQRQRLRVEAEFLRDQVRMLLAPHENIEDLDIEKYLDGSMALGEKIKQLADIKKKIAILSRELGEK